MRRLVLLALVACSHPPPPAAPPSNVAPKPADYSATIADPYGFLPGDSDLVMRIDLRELRKSGVWNDYEPQIVKAVFPDYVTCGFDPLATVDSVTAGVPSATATAEGVFVIRGLDRDKAMRCLTQPGGRTKVTVDGDVISLANESGNLNLMTFVSPTVAVMLGSHHPTREGLEHVVASGSPLRQWAAFDALEAKLEPHAAVAIMINSRSPLLAKMAASGIPANTFYGTLRVQADKIALAFHVQVKDAPTAVDLAASWDGQLGSARSMFEKLAATSSGNTVTVSAELSETQLRAIWSMVSGMFGQLSNGTP